MGCALGADGEWGAVRSARIGSSMGFCEASVPSRKDPVAQAASKWVRPILFGQAATRRTLQSRKSAQRLFSMGASHVFWSGSCAMRSYIEKVGPMIVFEAAFNGEHGVGSAFDQRRLSPLSPKNGTHPNGMHPWSIRRMERCPLGLNRVLDRLLRSVKAILKESGGASGLEKGAPHFFGQVAARRTLQSRKSARQLLSTQRSTVSQALAPASERRRLAPLNPTKTACTTKTGRIPMLLVRLRRDAASH